MKDDKAKRIVKIELDENGRLRNQFEVRVGQSEREISCGEQSNNEKGNFIAETLLIN